MRVLIIEDDAADAMAMQRELSDRYEVTVARTMAGALFELGTHAKPDIIITDLLLPDSQGPHTLEALREAAPNIPVIVCSGHLTDALRKQLDLLGATHLHDKNDGFAILRAVLHQTNVFHQTIAEHKLELISEIDKVARKAADDAVGRAINQLVDRLGLQDEEGLRMAVRLARGWDAAKSRFLSAIATGLAAALLLALAAGIVAMVRNEAMK